MPAWVLSIRNSPESFSPPSSSEMISVRSDSHASGILGL